MTNDKSPELIIPKLIVGLGNPGTKYEQTRHNIGFDAVDALANSWQCSWQEQKRFQAMFSEGLSPTGAKIYLLKPLTYMNRSGQSVRAVLDWYKLPVRSLLVVYDDLDLPLGRLRMRLSGSAGGHNGMKSIISHLNSQDFPRMRLGIGKANHSGETIDHVLGKFAPEERKLVREVIILALDAIALGCKQGVEKSMSLYNARSAV